jgi:hypothetical protein
VERNERIIGEMKMSILEELDLIAEEQLEAEIEEHLRRGTDYPDWLYESLKRIETEDKLTELKED